MDGRGQWRDNVFVERLWKSVKYEDVYLKAYESVSAARIRPEFDSSGAHFGPTPSNDAGSGAMSR